MSSAAIFRVPVQVVMVIKYWLMIGSIKLTEFYKMYIAKAGMRGNVGYLILVIHGFPLNPLQHFGLETYFVHFPYFNSVYIKLCNHLARKPVKPAPLKGIPF